MVGPWAHGYSSLWEVAVRLVRVVVSVGLAGLYHWWSLAAKRQIYSAPLATSYYSNNPLVSSPILSLSRSDRLKQYHHTSGAVLEYNVNDGHLHKLYNSSKSFTQLLSANIPSLS